MRNIWFIATVVLAVAVAVGVATAWLYLTQPAGVGPRLDANDAYVWPTRTGPGGAPVAANTGTLERGKGAPSTDPGSWTQFRGADRNNIADAKEKLLRTWPANGPEVLWRVSLGEGHAAAAVRKGRVFIIDYDDRPGKKEDVIRCLSLADGTEIWRYSYSVVIKSQHGITRTVPAVNDDYVVTMGPKCHVTCLKMETGEAVWKMDLAREFKTEVPPWYTGQCPLIDGDAVILAPGGDPLMMAVELATGKVRWKTPNPGGWGMTHSSVTAMDYAGSRQYVYCTTKGVVGVDARDGKVLWTNPWTVGYALVPTPVVIAPDRLFLAGGYKTDSVMLKLSGSGGSITTEEVFRCAAETFGSEEQTPILWQDHLYAVIPKRRGQLACMDLDGQVRWTSGENMQFHLGPYLAADGLLLVLSAHPDTDGVLYLFEPSADGAAFKELAHAKVLNGVESWGPMALVNGKLLVRNTKEMVCLKVGWREP